MEWIEQLFNNHGYLVLFLGLLLEYIALPFPGETTMTYAGYLSYQGILEWHLASIYAFAGTTIGMTITYGVGYLVGMPFVRRYGRWVLLSEDKINHTKRWFEKYGYFLLFIGYFIPGVRHFTGYFSGIVRIPFRKFALYAYTGALFWVLLFIWLGKTFGPQWESIMHLAEKYLGITIIVIVVIVISYVAIHYRVAIRKLRRKIIGSKSKSGVAPDDESKA